MDLMVPTVKLAAVVNVRRPDSESGRAVGHAGPILHTYTVAG